ncbi:MAG: hypothetical protein AB8G18_19320 [Gammaproteobacteria bacterium]
MIFNSKTHSSLSLLKQGVSFLAGIALLTTISLLGASRVQADLVQVTYSIYGTDFLNSNNGSPPAPTSTELGGTVTVTYNTEIVEQLELFPDQVSGFSMTDNDGDLIQYDTLNTGVNVRTSIAAGNDNHRITFGGRDAVDSMTGLSEDIRIAFEVSSVDYTVQPNNGSFVGYLAFVTTADAFYASQTTVVELLNVTVVPDNDGDGVPDTADNCVAVSNLDQRDTNGDDIGNACDPDFNQDCLVNFVDLSTLAGNFLMSGDLDTDLDGDGVTNFTDFSVLSSYMFGTPGPSGLNNACSP